MKRLSGVLSAAVCVCAVGAATPALADNPIGAYVGVGVGQSNVGSNDQYDYGYYGGYRDHDAAWKAIIGIRPLPIVGAEVEYLDFGSGNGNNGYYGSSFFYENASSHPKAAILYGVGYVPLPLPFLDVFGKAGVARLKSDIATFVYPNGPCAPPYTSCPAPTAFRTDQTDTKFAYGAGVQARFQQFAFRAEYERISSQFGDPAAVTVSATWTF